MSNRFGGRFSPDARHEAQRPLPAPRHRLDGRPKWVTIAAVPFLIGAFFQPALGMITDLAAFGLVAAGMRQTREGLLAEAAYDARSTARRPAFPRKLLGGVAAGIGLGLGAAEPGAVFEAGLIGLAALALHLLAFGPDPMRDKGMEGIDRFQQDRAARMIDEAQAHLDQMTQAIRRCGERRLEARVSLFEAAVQDLFEQLRQRPGDLGQLRRYLGVYLIGARDATIKFADLYSRTRDAGARAAYEAFLTDLEDDFSLRSQSLLEGSRSDLDIEMSVLRERLEREGVRPVADLRSDEARTIDDLLRGPVAQHRDR